MEDDRAPGTVCCPCGRARFLLKHAVAVNYSGKTTLVFFGFIAAMTTSLNDASRVVCGVNAAAMLVGSLWYTSYWSVEDQGGIDRFFRDQPGEHVLTDFPSTSFRILPSTWLFSASLYYVGFFIAFLMVYLSEPAASPQSPIVLYLLAASLWHVWIFALLFGGSLLACCRGPMYVPYAASQADECGNKIQRL